MISIVKLLTEDNLPATPEQNAVATTPQVDRVESDLDQIRNAFAEALDVDPSEVQVTKSEKKSIEDYADMSMTGDILISCEKAHEMGADRVAQLLNGFRFLDNIEINGQSGNYLCALVFGESRRHGGGADMMSIIFGNSGLGDLAGGDVIVTSKSTEQRIIPFLDKMGMGSVSQQAFEHYWNGIGGKIISDEDLKRIQAQLAAAGRPQLGRMQRGAIGAGRRRQPVMIPRRGANELDEISTDLAARASAKAASKKRYNQARAFDDEANKAVDYPGLKAVSTTHIVWRPEEDGAVRAMISIDDNRLRAYVVNSGSTEKSSPVIDNAILRLMKVSNRQTARSIAKWCRKYASGLSPEGIDIYDWHTWADL